MGAKVGVILFRKFYSSFVIFFVSVVPVFAQGVNAKVISENCDYPLGTILAKKTLNVDSCLQLCKDTKGCVSFVFVSGWNNCQLKSKKQKQFAIVMHGGKKDGNTYTDFGDGYDAVGKDLRRVSAVDTVMKCKEHCSAESACAGYTWIQGYNDCWLKKNVSGKIAKRFFCGVLP